MNLRSYSTSIVGTMGNIPSFNSTYASLPVFPGCCPALDEAQAAARRSKYIDRELDKERDKKRIKLLLLGTAECGKSTILKQVQMLADQYFLVPDFAKSYIRMEILRAVVDLHEGCSIMHLIQADDELTTKCAIIKKLIDGGEIDSISERDQLLLKAIWADEMIQRVYRNRAALNISDSVGYFFPRLGDICSKYYKPTLEDYLHLRIQTTGIQEHKLNVRGADFIFVDVGGQRSERKKWFNCFENVDAIIYIVAVSEYDQTLRESDDQGNRLVESLVLFRSITTNELFGKSTIILFLNKIDLFEAKIATKSINCAFTKYTGGNGYDESIGYIKERFAKRANRGPRAHFYMHTTCATDRSQVSVIINSTVDAILSNNLRSVGQFSFIIEDCMRQFQEFWHDAL